MKPTGHAHDPRHRFSYEVRPCAELDARVREVAAALETEGLVEHGASAKPRFQPHVTLVRAERVDVDVAHFAASRIEVSTANLSAAGTFGGGRIVYAEPDSPAQLHSARASIIDGLGTHSIDPIALDREYTPHVTFAYAVPEQSFEAALASVAAALPLRGAWATLEVWDLDVRPTRLVHTVRLDTTDSRA